jgi:hypothetical protein
MQKLRVLTISDGLIFALFDVEFPFRFPHAVGREREAQVGTDRAATAYGRKIKVV